jgi:hypothetical protein
VNISPRKNEVEAVLSVLDEHKPVVVLGVSPEYAAERLAMGKALIKAVWVALMDRDFYVYAYRFPSGPPTLPFGPFTSRSEAERFAKNVAIDARGSHVVVKVYGPAPADRIATLYPAQEATA